MPDEVIENQKPEGNKLTNGLPSVGSQMDGWTEEAEEEMISTGVAAPKDEVPSTEKLNELRDEILEKQEEAKPAFFKDPKTITIVSDLNGDEVEVPMPVVKEVIKDEIEGFDADAENAALEPCRELFRVTAIFSEPGVWAIEFEPLVEDAKPLGIYELRRLERAIKHSYRAYGRDLRVKEMTNG